MEQSASCRREILNSQFGNNATIHQGDHTYNVHIPLRPARSAVRIIPYPLNEDLVSRPDLMEKLNELLPRTSATYCSAALWGLGGSGKTQIALNYAYQRCKNGNCSVFWVHADSEATFSQDYQTIAQKFGINGQLQSEELYEAVRDKIAAQPEWVLVLDNADELRLFGVNQAPEQKKSLFQYVPWASTGTVLWTSRDAHIAGTLVSSRRSIKVSRMKSDEAETLLKMAGSLEIGGETPEVISLLEELEWLPLAITQAGAYMRRTLTSAKEYSSLLAQSKRRWDILKANEFDRHRRANVPNNVLETWGISIDRLRQENKIAYNILHVLAYLANQHIPHEMITAILKRTNRSLVQPEKLEAEATNAVTRLKEFSFLGVQEMEDGGMSYEMHKLVQEAARYGLSLRRPDVSDTGPLKKKGQGYFSGIAVKVMLDLFPVSEPKTWAQCKKYLAHAVQMGDWTDLNEKQAETSLLFNKVSGYFCDRGRWREREVINKREVELDRKTWGEKHPNTITSMANLATTYRKQIRYKEAEEIEAQVLHLQREIFGYKHPETISGMSSLATTYRGQGRYDEAEEIAVQVLDLRRKILGDEHLETISGMAQLASTYYSQGRYEEAEKIEVQVLDLRRKILGDKHPDTLASMHNLAHTWKTLRRRSDALALMEECVQYRRSVLGPEHLDTVKSTKYVERWKSKKSHSGIERDSQPKRARRRGEL